MLAGNTFRECLWVWRRSRGKKRRKKTREGGGTCTWTSVCKRPTRKQRAGAGREIKFSQRCWAEKDSTYPKDIAKPRRPLPDGDAKPKSKASGTAQKRSGGEEAGEMGGVKKFPCHYKPRHRQQGGGPHVTWRIRESKNPGTWWSSRGGREDIACFSLAQCLSRLPQPPGSSTHSQACLTSPRHDAHPTTLWPSELSRRTNHKSTPGAQLPFIAPALRPESVGHQRIQLEKEGKSLSLTNEGACSATSTL